MIIKFDIIKKIGCFEELSTNGLRPFDKVNIIFGNNGSGKTTFSNILYLLSKHCKDKQTLFEEITDKDSVIEIQTDSENITLKNVLSSNKDIFVFNSKFVSDSVYNGNSSNIDSFSNELKLTNETIKLIDNEIEHVNLKTKKVQNWKIAIQDKQDAIWKSLTEEFQTKVSNARLTNVKPSITFKTSGNLILLKSELSKLYWNYENIFKQAGTISRLEAHREKLNTISNFDLDLSNLTSILDTPISQSSKSKIQNRIAIYNKKVEEKNIQTQIGDVNNWFKKGGRLLFISKEIDKHCPLCDTDLSDGIETIIKEYTTHFSESIIKLFEFLDSTNEYISKLLSNNFIQENKTIAADIVATIRLYDIENESYEFEKQDLLLQAINSVLFSLKEKKASPETRIIVKEEEIEQISEYQEVIKKFKDQIIAAINKEIELLKEKSVDSVIKDIKEKIKDIASVQLNQSDNLIFSSKTKTNSDIALASEKLIGILEPKIQRLEINRSEEISKLNAESKFINLYLRHFGINHFSIEKVKDKVHDNIVITFTKTGRRKSKFGYSLSEGEKTALAFAYFISKLRVEKIEGNNEEFQDCIIVIDDPISSLDDNRVFQTANLIDSFLFFNKETIANQPKQVFILSHSLVFVKYMYNALRTNNELKNNLNEYYLSNLTPNLIDLPSSLKNFTNTYISKLKTIIDFKDKKIDYDNVKNYLPNYIRIVLETFLAFKLARVNDGEKLPGLDYLIKSMVIEFKEYEDKEVDNLNKDKVIERLNHLKKIADHESHGNIHKAEEFVFISEQELREFAKHTLQVISYIDEFHFKKVKGHS
jgi:wobble nucleotide-excising tRNase